MADVRPFLGVRQYAQWSVGSGGDDVDFQAVQDQIGIRGLVLDVEHHPGRGPRRGVGRREGMERWQNGRRRRGCGGGSIIICLRRSLLTATRRRRRE